jgi:prevent-host-death family protein
MKTMSAATFKAQCLAVLDRVTPEGIVITKRGRPVARLLPFAQPPARRIGALRGKLRIRGKILSTGLRWDASGQS